MKLIKIFAFSLLLASATNIQANTFSKDPLYFLNCKAINKAELEKISPDAIASVSVLKGKDAISKYGRKAKRGVVEITTKK